MLINLANIISHLSLTITSFYRGWIIHSAGELHPNRPGCKVQAVACLKTGLCLVPHVTQCWSVAIRTDSGNHKRDNLRTKDLELNPSAPPHDFNTAAIIVKVFFEEPPSIVCVCCFLSTWGTPVVSVKSRGWSAITCRDASAQPGTHQLPSGCIRVRKPCQHAQHKGLVLKSRGRQRREVEDDRGRQEAGEGRQEAGEVQVIAGYDSGGQCQASFRIHSLRSSCYIFYWRNKRMACYVRMRAIFLRVASKGTKRKRECLWERKKNPNFFFQEHKDSQHSAHYSLFAARCLLSLLRRFSPCHCLGQKPPQIDSPESCLQHLQTNQYLRFYFISAV